jgi:hypothetical protein
MQLVPIQSSRQKDTANLPGKIVLSRKGEGIADDGSSHEGGKGVDPEEQSNADDTYGMQGKSGSNGNGGPQGGAYGQGRGRVLKADKTEIIISACPPNIQFHGNVFSRRKMNNTSLLSGRVSR